MNISVKLFWNLASGLGGDVILKQLSTDYALFLFLAPWPSSSVERNEKKNNF